MGHYNLYSFHFGYKVLLLCITYKLLISYKVLLLYTYISISYITQDPSNPEKHARKVLFFSKKSILT